MLSPGDVLQERYEIETMLGKGGFGAVYRARDRRLKRQVAVKETLHLNPDILRLFEREAEVLARLEHPALPAVTDYFSEENTYYTVMSFIPGHDLGDYLDEQPQHRLEEQKTLEIILPVLEALEYLHSRTPPVIHRDIKPGNIRINLEGRVYLVDFGLAKPFDAQPVSTLSVVALTPSFSPPEQYYQQADTRSDIYALGATMYVMLGGTNPTPAHERMSGKELVPIQEHNPEASPEVEALITRALAVRPEDRYQTAKEFRQAIQSLLAQRSRDDTEATRDRQAIVAAPEPHADMTTRAITDIQVGIPTQESPESSAAPDEAAAQKPHGGTWLTPLQAAFQRLCNIPIVQNIAARLPLPENVQPVRGQIVLGGGLLLLVLLLLMPIALLAGGSQSEQAGTIAMSDETRAQVFASTIKIEAEGSFAYPTDTWRSWIGQGSGVILDETGIALTSHHVVAGAGTLQVRVGKEENLHIARLLGSSECLDLAVIDIEGEGFPAREWYEGSIEPGLAVFAAGFPRGEELSLSRGVVTNPTASGETSWVALNSIIEHDAMIKPGGSGGPLVTVQGDLVGINYRSLPGEQRHAFALNRDDILTVFGHLQKHDLRDGSGVLSIGVNGEIVQGEEVAGIWVYAVESGSLADRARVRPGDIITHLEGVSLGNESTLAKYCRVLRSHEPDDVLALRVVRGATGDLFEGQLNGRELELVEAAAVPGPVVINEPGTVLSAENSGAVEEGAAMTPSETATALAPTTLAPLTPSPTAENAPPNTGVIPIVNLSQEELEARRRAFQTQRESYEQVLDETFETRQTRSRWMRDNNRPNLRHRLIHGYYELTLKEPGVGLVDPWNHRRLGDTYIVEMDVAFENPEGVGAGGILFDMQGSHALAQFLVYNNGMWEVHTMENGETVPSRSASFPSDAIKPTDINHLRLVRMPDKVEFWINDVPVGTAPAEEMSGRGYYVGITGASGSEGTPITMLIDNLFVWK